MRTEKTYMPLMDGLIIKRSEIHGHGLFTNSEFEADITLGTSHIEVDNELIRTPLGGFYNHSETPNCIKVKNGKTWRLNTLRKINAGEEITVKYTFYNIK